MSVGGEVPFTVLYTGPETQVVEVGRLLQAFVISHNGR